MGAVIFHAWEGWDWASAAYFCFITLSTVMMGMMMINITMIMLIMIYGAAGEMNEFDINPHVLTCLQFRFGDIILSKSHEKCKITLI